MCIYLVIKANILSPKNFSFCRWFCSMHSTLSVLLLISKRGIFYKKLYLPSVCFDSWPCWHTVPGCETRKISNTLGVESEGQGGQLEGLHCREQKESERSGPASGAGPGHSWPCVLQLSSQPRKTPHTRLLREHRKPRQSTSKARVAAIRRILGWSEWPQILYQLPLCLCSCLLSNKIYWDTQHRLPLLSNCTQFRETLASLKSESHSVVSTLRPHGLYSLWNSPGQNTGVDSLSLLHPGIELDGVSSTASRFFTNWAIREASLLDPPQAYPSKTQILSYSFFFFFRLVYLFLVALGLRCCGQAFL